MNAQTPINTELLFIILNEVAIEYVLIKFLNRFVYMQKIENPILLDYNKNCELDSCSFLIIFNKPIAFLFKTLIHILEKF